jgi:hypothetical protein
VRAPSGEDDLGPEAARDRLQEFRKRYRELTDLWSRAASDPCAQEELLPEIRQVEARVALLEPLAVPAATRVQIIRARIASRLTELDRVLADYDQLDGARRGESLKRVLDKVTLYWRKLPYKRTQFQLLVESTEFAYRRGD